MKTCTDCGQDVEPEDRIRTCHCGAQIGHRECCKPECPCESSTGAAGEPRLPLAGR